MFGLSDFKEAAGHKHLFGYPKKQLKEMNTSFTKDKTKVWEAHMNVKVGKNG